MDMIKINDNYAKVKGAILTIIILIGGALGGMLLNAEEYFDLLKAGICAIVFFILVFLYVHLEHIDPEVEEIKLRLGPAIKEMKPEDEINLIENTGRPNPPS